MFYTLKHDIKSKSNTINFVWRN